MSDFYKKRNDNSKRFFRIALLCAFLAGTSIFSGTSFAQDIINNASIQTNREVTPLQARVTMIDLNSDKLDYYQEKNEMVATGSATLDIKDQNSRLEADKITYDQEKQIVIAEGNVKITKQGKIITGEYAKIDLNKESALINEPTTEISKVSIKAKTADVYPNSLIIKNGRASINNRDLKLQLSSNEFSPKEVAKLTDENILSADESKPPRYKITCKEIIINNKGEKSLISIRNATIRVGKIKVASIPSLELSTDNQITRIETMLPEMGYTRDLGGYFGPSHVFNIPNGSTLKVSPLLMAGTGDSKFGFGGMARYTSFTNKTEIAYGTLKDKLVLRGEQKLFSPYTKLRYGSNSYIDDGIFGDKKARYLAEIVDERKLGSAMNFDLFTRASAGYAEDYGRSFGTGRFKLQGDLINDKPLFSIKNDLLQFRLHSQFDVSVYGNGDTFALLRAGPRFDSKIGRLKLTSTYFQAGIHGQSPFEFDRYDQGRSNLIVGGEYKLTNYLDIGHIRNLNLTRDRYDGRLSTESQFYARVGPEDFKFKLGYDTVRKRSTFGLDLMLGSGRTALDFDRLKVYQTEK